MEKKDSKEAGNIKLLSSEVVTLIWKQQEKKFEILAWDGFFSHDER